MFAPLNVSVPAPALVRLVTPVPSLAIPENVVDVASPTVNVLATPELVTVPAPARDPIVSSKPPKSSVPAEATVTAEPLPKAPETPATLSTPALSVPVVTVVAPV